MKKNDEKGTFSCVQHGDTTPFPLDYTAKEVEHKWRIHRDHIRSYILYSPSFVGFYRWMRYVNADDVVDEKYEHRGIPVELEPFFHAYLDEYMKGDWNSDESKLQEFEHEFCKKLHKEACALEQKVCREEKHVDSTNGASANKRDSNVAPNALYWYRRLYENTGFQETISASYWEREYNYRAELIRELSLKLPLEMQVAQLQKVIASMDTQIASMLYIINGENKNKATNQNHSFLATFPQEVIGKLRDRVTKANGPSGRVGYNVHNFTIATEVCGETKEKSLEKFFDDIRSNKNTKSTRDAVRPYYLQDVCKIPEQSEFQRVCIQLQKYIDTYVDDKKTQEEQERYIIRRCKVYYEPFFYLSATPVGHLQPGYDRSAGAEIVIDELISSLYSDFYRKYNHEINTTTSKLSTYQKNMEICPLGRRWSTPSIHFWSCGCWKWKCISASQNESPDAPIAGTISSRKLRRKPCTVTGNGMTKRHVSSLVPLHSGGLTGTMILLWNCLRRIGSG